jgi:DNA-directed RNA polymerase beta subunit
MSVEEMFLDLVTQLDGHQISIGPGKVLTVGIRNVKLITPALTVSEAFGKMVNYTASVSFDVLFDGETHSITLPFLYPIGGQYSRFDPIGEMESELTGTFCCGGKIRSIPYVERTIHNRILHRGDRLEIRSEHLGPAFRFRSTSTIHLYVGNLSVKRDEKNKRIESQVLLVIPFLPKHPIPLVVILMALGETRDSILKIFKSPLCEHYRPSEIMLTRLCLALDEVSNQDDALKFILRAYEQAGKPTKIETVKATLRSEILPHMTDSPYKNAFLVYMGARVMWNYERSVKPDCLDDYRFIAVDDAMNQIGALMRRHLRSSPVSLMSRLAKYARARAAPKNTTRRRFDGTPVAVAIIRAIGTGRWSDVKHNVSEAVQPQNVYDVRAATRRINAACSDTSGTHLAMRITHPTSHGYVCCVETPDGGKSGLVGALALYACVSQQTDDPIPVIDALVKIKLESGKDRVFDHLGRLIGWCEDRNEVLRVVRFLRRGFHISPMVGVSFAPGEVHIEGARGRIMRMIRIAGVPDDPTRPLYDRLVSGSVEYLCAAEEFTTDVVTSYREGPGVTHVEISDVANLGDLAAVEPFGAYQQGPRRAFESHMRRSATACQVGGRLGMPTSHRLSYAQSAIVTTKAAQELHLDATTYLNMITAILPHPRATDDGLVISKRFVDLLPPIIVHKTYTALSDDDSLFRVPSRETTSHISTSDYSKLQENGIPAVGTLICDDDIVIGQVVRRVLPSHAAKKSSAFRDISTRAKLVTKGRVIEATASRGVRRVVVATSHALQRGDKLVMTSGAQKGVIAFIESPENMPFCADGQPVDLLIPPESFPSRMTPSLVNVMVSGLSYAVSGVSAHDTQVLNGRGVPETLQKAMRRIADLGFQPEGSVRMVNPATGELYSSAITVGIIPVMVIHRHNAADKSYARADGPKNAVRQTTQGRQHDGGLRLGTMEGECIQAHGATRIISSFLTDNADKFTVYVCGKCGFFCRGNTGINVYFCDTCCTSEHVRRVPFTYSSMIMFNELEAAGIQARFELEDAEPAAKRLKV